MTYNGSGSGMPKNMRILRIPNSNTGKVGRVTLKMPRLIFGSSSARRNIFLPGACACCWSTDCGAAGGRAACGRQWSWAPHGPRGCAWGPASRGTTAPPLSDTPSSGLQIKWCLNNKWERLEGEKAEKPLVYAVLWIQNKLKGRIRIWIKLRVSENQFLPDPDPCIIVQK